MSGGNHAVERRAGAGLVRLVRDGDLFNKHVLDAWPPISGKVPFWLCGPEGLPRAIRRCRTTTPAVAPYALPKTARIVST